MDRVTLDFENNTVEWDMDTQKGTEDCPELSGRKEDIIAAMGYEMWDTRDVVGAVNSFINGRITADEMNDVFDAELEKSQTLSFLPLKLKAFDVLHAAEETYANYGDDAYAKSKAHSFLRQCGVQPEYGPSYPVRRWDIERVVYAMLDVEPAELFWRKLYYRLESPHGWVSVETKLPSDSAVVLVFAPHQQQLIGYFDHKRKEWFYMAGDNPEHVQEGMEITHWRAFPEPPARADKVATRK